MGSARTPLRVQLTCGSEAGGPIRQRERAGPAGWSSVAAEPARQVPGWLHSCGRAAGNPSERRVGLCGWESETFASAARAFLHLGGLCGPEAAKRSRLFPEDFPGRALGHRPASRLRRERRQTRSTWASVRGCGAEICSRAKTARRVMRAAAIEVWSGTQQGVWFANF
jgi:hypothetical protein